MNHASSRRRFVSGLAAVALAATRVETRAATGVLPPPAPPTGADALAQAGHATSAQVGQAARSRSLSAAPSRVLVAGATGRLGGLIVAALQARGVAVRALARDATRARGTLPAEVEIVAGDLREPEGFAAVLQDVTTVVFAATATAGGAGENTPEKVDYGGVAGLLRVLGPRRLQQFLLVSSAAVTQRLHPHNLWNDILLWKLRGEELLRASGQPYTIVRPCGLRGYPGGLRTIQLTQGDRFAFGYVIAREDAARLCAAAVGLSVALGKTFEAYNDDAAPVDLERQLAALHPDA
jgi:uncharacterized protein YbjT (DUF2867 family)